MPFVPEATVAVGGMCAPKTHRQTAFLTQGEIVWSVQVTSLILVVLVDGPLAEDVESGPDSLEVGVWLLVGCFAAATFLSWLWSGRCATPPGVTATVFYLSVELPTNISIYDSLGMAFSLYEGQGLHRPSPRSAQHECTGSSQSLKDSVMWIFMERLSGCVCGRLDLLCRLFPTEHCIVGIGGFPAQHELGALD